MMGKRKQVRSGAILVGIGLFIVLLLVGIQQVMEGVTIKKLFSEEVSEELVKVKFPAGVFTEEDLLKLPEPIQRYFRFAGFLGKEKMSTARLTFHEVDFINGNRNLKLFSEQYNFVGEPARIVYMSSKLFGILPFEGRDKYQRGQGYMTGKLAKFIELFNETGPEMDQSALVTFLAEVLIVPNCALQTYITWEALDENNVQATIFHQGLRASGIFTINDAGEFVMFRTNDRYMDQGNGSYKQVPWRIEVVGYQEQQGLRLPERVQGIWEMPEGDLIYFDGELSGIEYNIKSI